MKPGDLVKRSDVFKRILEDDDCYMTLEEEQEIGIIVEIEFPHIVVHWPVTGVSWEEKNNLEKTNGD